MHRIVRVLSIFALAVVSLLFGEVERVAWCADAATGYQAAPAAIRSVLDSPPTPLLSLDPTRQRAAVVQGVRYPPIAELAHPMLRLAGLRINSRTNGPHAPSYYVGMTVQTIADGVELPVRLPAQARVGFPHWSPDGGQLAFWSVADKGLELWVADARTGAARAVPGLQLNATLGDAIAWMPDSETLLCRAIPAGRGSPPAAPEVPAGPTIQESTGQAGPVRTYQDLLTSPHDEALFDYYATTQLMLVGSRDGKVTPVGTPGVVAAAEPSPDGKYLLVVLLRRPYSYLHPAGQFPKEVAVWDLTGNNVFQLANLPLEERVPIEGVPTGPRSYHWRPTEPATLVWVEALDEGDPRRQVEYRDRLRMLAFPFRGEPIELARIRERFARLDWAEHDGLALLSDYDRDRRWTQTRLIRVDRPGEDATVVWDRSIRDRYGDPGMPLMRTLPSGHRVLWQHGSRIFLGGEGATPRGDRPFLDRLDLATLQSERLVQCDEESYETVVALLDADGSRFITRYETPSDPPNFFVRSLDSDQRRAITRFPDPAPQLRGIRKQLVTYQRADGVPLSFTLYLPPNYDGRERLPTVVWAYPREFNDAGTAGQVSGSTQTFTTISGTSHLFLLLAGYAILDGASMPVIGTPETMNDTYVRQIVSSAQAAIDKAVELGVTDRQRVGVGGHSYGAFMTANLLAHCDLFQAGVARSGAYNRTLTPFGFQSERRTFWEAPDTYLKVSPFSVADRIKEPLLLIHGEADDNSGTFPMQSERMYQAVRGNGGTVRLVLLPYESHGYSARESVEHTLYEMTRWFDKYLKK